MPTARQSARWRDALLAPQTAWLLGGLFVLAAVVVDLGFLTWLDQWAVDHVMPALRPRSVPRSVDKTLIPIFHVRRGMDLPLAAATYGDAFIASALPALALTAVGCVYLERRGRRRLALWIAVAFVAVNTIEFVAKSLIGRPALYGIDPRGVRVRVLPFESSFPSGHAARAVLLAVLLTVCAARFWPIAAAWLASVLVLLVLGGWHTPSDLLGAVLLAGAFAVPVLRIGIGIESGDSLVSPRGARSRRGDGGRGPETRPRRCREAGRA